MCFSIIFTWARTLGQLSYPFVPYTLLPGVAAQIKKLTSVKVLERILYVFLLTQVTVFASGSHRVQSKQLSLSHLDRMPSQQPSSPLSRFDQKKEKTALTLDRRCG